ncbi:MAG: DUF5123 domain-containing protein [Prolixibacteraceae bacterium]|nr:DUF5123 domain-containing protein [Prolixibacteraceae bacterium]
MKSNLKNIGFMVGLISLILVSCKDKIDPIVEQLDYARVFKPISLTAKIKNKTTVELAWTVGKDASSYVIEFSEDSLKFSAIVKTVTVAPDKIPVSVVLDGQTQYSARIKGVSASGVPDSKWSAIAFKTDAENIFSTLAGTDIQATSVTLKWPAGSDVTNFVITPGNVQRTITALEKAAGVATITGLTGETDYTVKLFKGTKQRGVVTFKTLIDLGGATAVYPADNLSTVIANANAGDALVLFPGNYVAYSGAITINKSISIKGLYPYNKPIVHVKFVLESGVQSVDIKDLEMNGNYTDPLTGLPAILDHAFQYNTTLVNYGTLNVTGCRIHDFDKSLFTGSSSIVSKIVSISMTDCIVTNILTNSADCIDFRAGYVVSLKLKNSTFNNCAPARDFVRLDNTAATFPGLVSNVEIDHCTLYAVSNKTSSRILYVRFATNTLKVTNSIIAGTLGYYTNQTLSAQPECSGNNYFNAPGFITGGSTVSGAKFDLSTSYTLLDPGFTNAAIGNFTVTNQTVNDSGVGDPRW